MLNELAALREAATTSKPVRPVAQPGWVSARRGQHHLKVAHAANTIQHEWRRMKLFEELQSGTDQRRMRLLLHAAEANPVSSRPIGSCSSLVAPRSFSPQSLRPELGGGSGVASLSRDAGSPPGSLRSTLGHMRRRLGSTDATPLSPPAGVLPTCHELNTGRGRTTSLESESCGLDSRSSSNGAEQGGGRGSQAVQGGSQVGGSLGGSQVGFSQRMSQKLFRRGSLRRSERERRAEDQRRRRRAEAAVLPKPERRLARQAGRGALLTHSDGSLFPLYTDTRTFDRFGTDVSQYFHFMYHSKSFFMFLFVINLSNIIVNIEGEGQTFSWFTVHTLGNTASDGVLAKGGHSYAVMEFLTAGCLVAYLFFIRGEMKTI